jgi:uncharacterized protein YggE
MADTSTVRVQGTGSTFSVPDIATFVVTVSEVDATSKEVVQKTNEKVTKVLEALYTNGAKKEHLKTNRIQVNPKFEYKNNESVQTGQEATVTIDVKLCKINPDGKVLGKLIDEIVVINNIHVGGVNFDLEDKTESKKKARTLAFADARDKAQQYAELSGLKLGKVSSIDESGYNYSAPVAFAYSSEAVTKGGQQTQVEVGEYETSTTATITWTLV